MLNRVTSERFFWGLILVLLGGYWTLGRAGVVTDGAGGLILLYWPVIFIFYGIRGAVDAALHSRSAGGAFPWGTTLLNLGFTVLFLVVLGNNNDWWDVNLSPVWRLFWPALALFAGIHLLVGGLWRPGARTYLAFMSGSKDQRTAWDDLTVLNIMGGTDLDLSRAGLPDREVVIHAYSLMGGGGLKVPPGVKVVCEQTALMGGGNILGREAGGLIDRRVIEAGEGPVVRLRCISLMGGVDVVQESTT